MGPTATDDDFLPSYGAPETILDSADAEVALSDTFAVLDPEDAEATEGGTRRTKGLGFGFWLAAAWMGLLLLLAIAAPYITEGESPVVDLLPNPNAGVSAGGVQNLPVGSFSEGHPLGTDNLGRDLLSRTIWGARVSLTVGIFAIVLGLLAGGFIGLVAGYFRGKLETVMMASMDVLLAFPALVLALAIVTFSGRATVPVITLAIGIVGVAPLARLVRANTLVYSQREFVLAARTLGAKNSRIIWREIVPNVSRAAFSFAIIGVAVAIVAEGGLAFVGVGLPPPEATWGTMINAGRADLERHPQGALVPSAALFLTVMALNFAGDRLRSYFDVKEGGL